LSPILLLCDVTSWYMLIVESVGSPVTLQFFAAS
jgi:hypothetical protein